MDKLLPMAKDRIASITFFAIATSFIVIVSLISSLPDALTKHTVTPPPYSNTYSGIVPQSVNPPPARNSASKPPTPKIGTPYHQRGHHTSSSKQVDQDLGIH